MNLTDNVVSSLRDRRSAAGLTQTELAERVGVSRQALSAIEAGRQVPSTTLALHLARALRCGVDDLFRLAGAPLVRATLANSVRGDERLAVGRVDGVLVAHRWAAESQSADGIVAGAAVAGETVPVELLADAETVETNLLVAGCAPLLGLVCERLGARFRDVRATWIPADSTTALDLLAAGRVHIAGIHLATVDDLTPHVEAARAALSGQAAALVNLATWNQGIVVAPGNPKAISVGAELLRPGLRWIVRDAGAGAQRMLERLVGEAGGEQVRSTLPAARNHHDVARLVRFGVADVGVAIESVALSDELGFLPVAEERFDLVVPQTRLHLPIVSRFIEILGDSAFRRETGALRGYDVSCAGDISMVSES